MALDDDIRTLSGVSLFEVFTEDQLRLLAFGAETVRLPAGSDLYREAEPADNAFIVIDGAIELYTEREGARIGLKKVSAGAVLGELALISESKRLTSAAAVDESELLKLSRKLFRRILEEYPVAAAALHRRITRQLEEMVAEIERLRPRFAE